MRVEIRDSYGSMHMIDSEDMQTVAQWFGEWTSKLASVNTMFNHPLILDIWPQTDAEIENIGKMSYHPVTSEGVRAFATKLWEYADELREAEWQSQVSSTTTEKAGRLWACLSTAGRLRQKFTLPIRTRHSKSAANCASNCSAWHPTSWQLPTKSCR